MPICLLLISVASWNFFSVFISVTTNSLHAETMKAWGQCDICRVFLLLPWHSYLLFAYKGVSNFNENSS